jgi:Protein of unknown function (DUF4235)
MAAKGAGGTSRAIGIVSSLIAGSLARKVITFGWKRVTGKEPPTDPHDPDVALKEALAWSLVVGVGMEAARLLVTRAVTTRMRDAHADAEGADEAAK